ncbi:MAG: uracil-DNA glycosylase [Vigna little leaf phytoplasma]|nr:uracil-DNA glycosylase [Vigna little leaf phytoplasma]
MWSEIIKKEKQKEYFQKILIFLKKQKKQKKIIYPPLHQVFQAFKLTTWDCTKVIILGQDPYHGINQAHGLAFSVLDLFAPPSLKNILQELYNDLHIIPQTNNLSSWARSGVLLINSILTVNQGEPLSHQNIGWEIFTNNIFKFLNQKKNLVYFLWGKYAQHYERYINPKDNYIIKSVHPSPLSAHRGFFGSKPFSRANQYLISHNIKPIDWHLR